MKADVLVVGAGFAGSVMAERLAAAGRHVVVLDQREHVGGNAFDCVDEHGILIHRYGPHVFHTQRADVFQYLSRFTEWRPYKHRVLSCLNGKLYPIPINQDTVNLLYGLSLDETGVKEFIERARTHRFPEVTSEDVVLNSVGQDLCEKFFSNYTRKQWGVDLAALDASVARRIPVRFNKDPYYFKDSFQCMPSEGFTALFKRMLDHRRIRVELGCDFACIRSDLKANHIIYTAPIDSYFDYQFGKLPYRSLKFEPAHFAETEQYQPVAVVNYPNEQAFTRITEFKHLTGQRCSGTSIAREYPRRDGDPFYPIPTSENKARYLRYRSMADKLRSVTFIGRLAEYRYYNMDEVVAAALAHATRIIAE